MTERDPKKKKRIGVTDALIIGSFAVIGGTEVAKRISPEEIMEQVFDGQHERNPEVQKLQEDIQNKYGVTVQFVGYDETHERRFDYSADRLTSKEAIVALEHLTIILSKYPPSFFKDNSLPQILIGKNFVLLERSDRPEEAVGGFAMYTNDFMALGFSENRDVFEETFHHEMFHLFDARDNGLVSEDKAWVDLHAECRCTPYVGDAWKEPKRDERRSQYASDYARRNPTEDRAVIGAALFSPYLHYELIQKIKSDDTKILQEKYDLIRATYERWSNGAINQAYWDEIIARGKTQVEALRGTSESYSDTYDYGWDYYYPDYKYEGEVVVVSAPRWHESQEYEGFSVDHPRYYDDMTWTTERHEVDRKGKIVSVERPTSPNDYEGFSGERSQTEGDSNETKEGPD
jgi:hypothetical protein